MTPDEKKKLEARADKLSAKMRELDEKQKKIRIEINKIYAKLFYAGQ